MIGHLPGLIVASTGSEEMRNPFPFIFSTDPHEMPYGSWTLMVGEGGGWAKITIIMVMFCHFMVKLYLDNGFNGLIDFFRLGLV